jgi:hypothetical protein
MRRIGFTKRNRSGNLLHIETEGAIVNIRVGLEDTEGREVTSIEILPDETTDEKWEVDGHINNRVIKVR